MSEIEIRNLYISGGHDFKGRFGMDPLRHPTPSVDSVECVAGKGIVGDRFFGYREDFKGQLTFIAQETIDDIAASLGLAEIEPRLFRRNAVIVGADLNALIGKRFRIGDIELFGSEECSPCLWMDQVVGHGALDLMQGRGGLRCRILSSGTLSIGSAELEVLD